MSRAAVTRETVARERETAIRVRAPRRTREERETREAATPEWRRSVEDRRTRLARTNSRVLLYWSCATHKWFFGVFCVKYSLPFCPHRST